MEPSRDPHPESEAVWWELAGPPASSPAETQRWADDWVSFPAESWWGLGAWWSRRLGSSRGGVPGDGSGQVVGAESEA